MANFAADTLRELSDLQEIAIRTEKHPETPVVIWVVVAEDEVFVRSVRGAKGRWYRDLATGGPRRATDRKLVRGVRGFLGSAGPIHRAASRVFLWQLAGACPHSP